jgi:UDP-N-acetyl-D-mannosaminuronic acid dehydrogenase
VVALLGLAFKPNVADLRESPALQVAHALSTQTTARLLAVEPNEIGEREPD